MRIEIGFGEVIVETDHWLPKAITSFNKVDTLVTIGNTIYLPGQSINQKSFRHEYCHVEQMHSLGTIPFLFMYFLEFGFKIIRYFNINKAYENISFEKQAYAAQELPLTEHELVLYSELISKISSGQTPS